MARHAPTLCPLWGLGVDGRPILEGMGNGKDNAVLYGCDRPLAGPVSRSRVACWRHSFGRSHRVAARQIDHQTRSSLGIQRFTHGKITGRLLSLSALVS